MAVRIQVPKKALWPRIFLSRGGRIFVGVAAGLTLLTLIAFTYYYVKYSRLIDAKLRMGPFQSTSMIFAAPQPVSIGDETTPEEIVAELRSSGYTESRGNRTGWYAVRPGELQIFPGPDSYFDDEAGVIKFDGARVSQIISLRDHTERPQYSLEPELITSLFDSKREKRRLVKFHDIPRVLVNAVISAEDKRFWQHAGFDPLRILKAVYVDLRHMRKEEGGSTLSQQLARQFWLSTEKTWSRKLLEVLVTLHIEQKLTKEEIFEYYANQVPLGQAGSFAIHGFGEGAKAYVGKDLSQLTLEDAALLAGLIQRPSWANPLRHPDRAQARRNVILSMMRDNGYITDEQYRISAATPVRIGRAELESVTAPYFVDLVNEELQNEFQDHDFQSDNYRIYTTLDMRLQRAASDAVRIGMQELDQRLSKRKYKPGEPRPEPQVALVALDAETGAIKALIGGRNYGTSQLNRALAKRQPGSSFKPFVYAAALNTAISGGPQVITPASRVMDEPTTFWFDEKPYAPSNFKNEIRNAEVTVRESLTHSLNIPTVKFAEMIGYDTVEDLAKKAGMNINIRPTPAIALGAYEVTPIEIAGSYTVFAHHGMYVKPNWITEIRDRRGGTIFENKPEQRQVLDQRVAFLMTNLMEDVLRSGTGASVRSRGFVLPAAGKTGTSHDGWFAGFTSKLICVVWVGFDDNRELNVEGAKSALPVWTEFMKRAHLYREYRNVHGWAPPDGIVMVDIDPVTGQLAMPACPSPRPEFFISGTQPIESCHMHGGAGGMRVASWEAPPPVAASANGGLPPSAQGSNIAGSRTRQPAPPQQVAQVNQPPVPPPPPEDKKKKKGFFGRILGVFK